MPAESAEGISQKDLGQNIVAERPVTPKELEDHLFITLGKKKEKQQALPEMDDEYNNQGIPILKPLKSVVVSVTRKDPYSGKEETVGTNYDDQLKRSFEHLSRTHKLETGTPKTQAIQEIVDKMVEGKGLETRIVVMNKGNFPNAFVFADGTIFVAQSLLNKLDTLDEVASVIAHEIEHLENKTFENKIQSHFEDQIGVGWAHEGASDTFTPTLLEKANLNSMAFSRAIQKVSGVERGVVHQGGNARASEVTGQHFVRNYRTSNNPHTSKPGEFKVDFTPTNLEIFNKFYSEKGYGKPVNLDHLKQILTNLHPEDFDQAYTNIIRHQYYIDDNKYVEGRIQRQIIEGANSIIFGRLKDRGFSDPEITTLLLSVDTGTGYGGSNLYLLKNSQQFDQVIDSLRSIEDNKKLDKMSETIFGKSFNQQSTTEGSDYRKKLLSLVQYRSYIEGFEERKIGVPITEDLLIKFLARLGEVYQDEGGVPKSGITNTLLSYVDKVYLPQPEQARTAVDEEQIRSFFEKVRAAGVMVYPDAIDRYIEEGKQFRTAAGLQKISIENQQIVKDVFCEVFEYTPEENEVFELTFKKIDILFENLNKALQEGQPDLFMGREFLPFVAQMRQYFNENNINDGGRLKFIEYMDQKISPLRFEAKYSIRDELKNDGSALLGQEVDPDDNDLFIKYNLRTFIGLSLFKQADTEFFSYMEKTMKESGIDYQSLSYDQLSNLCLGFLALRTEYSRSGSINLYGKERITDQYIQNWEIVDYQRFFDLPFLKRIIEQGNPLQSQTLKELNEAINALIEKSQILKIKNGKCDLYDDSLGSLILGKAARENFQQILSTGISDQDFADLYEFIDKHYTDGVIKNQLLSEINKQYLHSTNVPLEGKTDYLILHYDRIGPEGTGIVAQQITNLETYVWFREKIGTRLQEYLKGSRFISRVAMSDFLTSYATKNFVTIFKTAIGEDKDKRQESTNFAQMWFERYFSRQYGENKIIDYDKSAGKFIFNKGGRMFFQTIADSIATLRDLSPFQRVALSHKLLTESNGAFSDKVSRKVLANILTRSLGFKKGFISEVLATACRKSDAALISFPAAQMIAPLLFRSLDVKSIDFDELSKTDVYQRTDLNSESKRFKLGQLLSRPETVKIANANTREITFFGADYSRQPDSVIAQIAQASDRGYFLVRDELIRLLSRGAEENKPPASIEINPSIEAVISGVEAGGALGVRALQLTTQMMQFSSPVEARLSQTLDANSGLDKVFFWENLYKLSSEEPEIRDFLGKVKLGDYLGGGSLYTTYSATLENDGQSEEIVLKMLNPNAEAFIESGYQQAKIVLEDVASQKGDGKNKAFAQNSMMLLNLSKTWCEADINDPSFEADDDRFKQVVSSFNQSFANEVFYVPTRKLNTSRLKSETKANGQTVNQFLQESGVSAEAKRAVVETMGRFLIYQLSHAPVVTEGGKTYRLLHSDPHVGNYVIDSSSGQPKLAVIDRHMYLKLEEQDVAILEKLVKAGNDNEFVYGFIDRVLDTNNVQGAQRQAITGKVFGDLRLEYVKQRIRGKVDRFSLMRTMLSELSEAEVVDQEGKKHNMDIPLNLRLMIRNIGAIKELARRNGVDFEALYKQVA